MTALSGTHPFDDAIALTRDASGRFHGRTHSAYANMVGPFGGITAAALLNAALIHPDRLGDPVALTVNYAGPVADGEFVIEAVASRTNRSTQHWSITLSQDGQIVTTATAVFALRRDTWTSTEANFPAISPAADLPVHAPNSIAAWTRQYDMRFVKGPLFDTSTPLDERDSVSTLWIRDEPPRPLDFASLAALCDAFFPRIMIRRPKRIPFGTVSITIHFHADAELLRAQSADHLLGTAKALHFGRGFHDQSAEVWSKDGAMIATSHQIAYFKE